MKRNWKMYREKRNNLNQTRREQRKPCAIELFCPSVCGVEGWTETVNVSCREGRRRLETIRWCYAQ